VGAKIGETRGFGSGLGSRVVGSVGVVGKTHVAGEVFDDGIRMSGSIVEEVDAGLGSGRSGAGLLGSNGAEGREHGVVDCSGIVEEDTDNFTDTFDSGLIKGWCFVLCGELDFGPILGRLELVGAVGRSGISVSKAGEGPSNVARHGEFDSAGIIVPVKVEATEFSAGPVDGDLVVFGENGDEVVGILFANILDPKVINNEGKHDGFGGVPEEAGGVAGFDKPSREELADELFVGKVGGLGKAVHSTINADVNKTIVGKGQEVVFVNETLGKGREWNLGKLRAFHLLGGEEVIVNVKGQETGFGRGHNTVEQQFGSVQFSSFGGDLMWVVDAVASGRGADAARFSFERAISYN